MKKVNFVLGLVLVLSTAGSLRAEGLPAFSTGVNLSDLKAGAAKMSTPAGQAVEKGVGDIASAYIALGFWTRSANLPDCGGTVELTTSNGQANVVFRNVVNCSNFDILSSNGESLQYPNHKLGGADRNRNGSFTIPKRFTEMGYNAIKIVVQSNSKKTRDEIRIEFFKWS